ncbi:hypothetical protein BJ973_007684 [Actinoplanes tereljensis]|uniref:hypothetical protein n=1 Tax=Paractinoplanes tereljensis TaxID=571912 RepID=UPI001941E7B7|nr:hypothetical protein [Actinoplanes tereljensis]
MPAPMPPLGSAETDALNDQVGVTVISVGVGTGGSFSGGSSVVGAVVGVGGGAVVATGGPSGAVAGGSTTVDSTGFGAGFTVVVGRGLARPGAAPTPPLPAALPRAPVPPGEPSEFGA